MISLITLGVGGVEKVVCAVTEGSTVEEEKALIHYGKEKKIDVVQSSLNEAVPCGCAVSSFLIPPHFDIVFDCIHERQEHHQKEIERVSLPDEREGTLEEEESLVKIYDIDDFKDNFRRWIPLHTETREGSCRLEEVNDDK